jgi:hypothetical protein
MHDSLSPEVAGLPARPGWRRLAGRTAGICGAALAAQLPAEMLFGWPMAPTDVAVLTGNQLVDFGCVGLVVALTLHAVERAADWPRRWRYALLVAGLVTAVCTQLKPGTAREFNRPDSDQRLEQAGIPAGNDGVRLHQIWFSAILASVSALYLLQRRESIDAERRRRLLEARWQQARRRVRILRDVAGAARLDPRVLFDCLGLARSEYLRGAPGADALLDRLIDFLRGTLSSTRSGPHTLGLELELALRFAAILPQSGCVQIVDVVPAALRQLDVGRGLLLPVVQQWLAQCEPAGASRQSPPLTIGASIEGAAARMFCFHLSGPAVEPDALLAESRLRLTDLYGSQASVRAAVRRTGVPLLDIRFELPLEPDHAD